MIVIENLFMKDFTPRVKIEILKLYSMRTRVTTQKYLLYVAMVLKMVKPGAVGTQLYC